MTCQGEKGTTVGEICRKAGISEATYHLLQLAREVRYEATASARGREWQTRVAGDCEAGLPAVPRDGRATAEQDAEAQGQGKAA